VIDKLGAQLCCNDKFPVCQEAYVSPTVSPLSQRSAIANGRYVMHKLLYPSIRVRTAPSVSVRVRVRVRVSVSFTV